MNFRLNKISVLAFIIILAGYIYIESFVSLFVWIFCFILGYFIFSKDRHRKNSDFYIFSSSFVIITFIGILNVIDYYNNTGTFFGFGGDDKFFFNNVIHILKHSDFLKENIGLYEYILAIPAEAISIFISRDLQIIDLLPFNWFLGATIPVLINSISKLLFKSEIKFEIILISLLLNHKYYDAVIHLYRDVLLFNFIIISIITYIRKKYIKFSVFTLLSAALRGAHVFLLVLFFTIKKIFDSANTVRNATILIILFVIAIVSYQEVHRSIFPYMSQFQYIERLSSTDYALDEIIEARKIMFSERPGHQNMLRQAMYTNNPAGILVGVLFQVFYPITFHFSFLDINSSDSSVDIEGFSFIEIVKWCSIIAWIWVIPLLVLGFISCYKRKGNGMALILFYVMSLFAISVISMQTRHGLIFVIFHPIICQLGYDLATENRNYLVHLKRYREIVLIFLLIWNVFRLYIPTAL